MYEGNPGEIDFGSSSRKVSEGLSYWESTVHVYMLQLLFYFSEFLFFFCFKFININYHTQKYYNGK